MILLLAALLLPSIHTDFEGGSLGAIETVSPVHFRLAVKGEADQDGRNRQANWYFFRVENSPSAPLTLDIVNLPGEYNYKPNRGAITKDTPPVISFDGIHWEHIQTFEYDPKEPKLVLHVRPRESRFWIAHCPPYTNETLSRLRNDIHSHADFREEIIGATPARRQLTLWTISHGGERNKPVVWLLFRQHSWESGSSWAGEGAIRTLLGDGAEPSLLRNRVVWKIFPLCDPDGVARGGVRFNVNGYDLNRNWDIADPTRMPEIAAQYNAIARWLHAGNHIDLLLSLHNTETGEYLEGPPGFGPNDQYRALAERLFALLSKETSFSPSRPLSFSESTTTLGRAGRMNVIQGLYKDFKVPGFIMEQRISYNPKLGRLPEESDRIHFGGELVRALSKALAR